MNGIHIRGVALREEDSRTISGFQMTIWPLPEEILPALNDAMRDAAQKFLRENKIAGEGITDLTDRSERSH